MPSKYTSIVGLGSVLEGFDDLAESIGGDAVYLTGSNVTYSIHLEFGTSKMPAYSWLRPAVDEFESNPRRFVRRHAGVDVDDLDSADDAVKAVALALESRMVDNVTAAGGQGSPGTHPEHPRRQTGTLASSIKAVRVS
jgi:hypothetical protein